MLVVTREIFGEPAIILQFLDCELLHAQLLPLLKPRYEEAAVIPLLSTLSV